MAKTYEKFYTVKVMVTYDEQGAIKEVAADGKREVIDAINDTPIVVKEDLDDVDIDAFDRD